MNPVEPSKQSSRRRDSLAVALRVTISKPAGVSLKDYILQLRRAITKIPQPQDYIDSVAFWKTAYANSQAVQTALQDRVFELEVQNEGLRGKTKETATLTPENASQRKRKRDAIESVPSRSTKAAEGSTLASKVEAKTALIMGELEVLTFAGTANSQIRHLHTLQQLIARKAPNPLDLASILVQLTSVIGQALWESKVTHPPEHEKHTTSIVNVTRGHVNKAAQVQAKIIEDHEILLRVLFRTFCYILKGLNKLAIDPPGAMLQGQVIYNIIKLFREALNFIATCDGLERPKQALKRGDTKTKKAVPATSYAQCPDGFCLRISRLLVMMIASLNPPDAASTNEAHQQIFEGFLYVLLERIRQVLRLFVFGDSECEGIPSVPEGSDSNNKPDKRLVSAKASAPSLIWILERAIVLFDRNMRHTRRPDVGLRGVDAPTTLPSKDNRLPTTNVKVNLAERAKRRLQHTLLKGFFDGDDADFANALDELKDPKLSLSCEVVVVKEDEVTDWFKREVERLVGWEVLSSRIAWDEMEDI